MSVLRMFSFDHVATADIYALVGQTGASPTVGAGPNSPGALVLTSDNAIVGVRGLPDLTGIWAHFRVKSRRAWPAYTKAVINLLDAQADPCMVCWNIRETTGLFTPNYSGYNPQWLITTTTNSPYGTATIELVEGKWYTVDLEMTVSDTVGTIKTWIDGVADLDLTGLDTKCAPGVYVNGVTFAVGELDDIAIGTLSGEANATAPRKTMQIDCHFPNANGTHREWRRSTGSDDFALVDDTAASTGTSDYLESVAIGDSVSLRVEALKEPGGTIYAVQTTAYLAKQNAGPCVIRPYVLIAGWKHYGDAWYPSWGTYQFFQYVWDRDPSAGPGAWTEAVFNAAEFGLKRIA
jgi:hypothetical protein